MKYVHISHINNYMYVRVVVMSFSGQHTSFKNVEFLSSISCPNHGFRGGWEPRGPISVKLSEILLIWV